MISKEIVGPITIPDIHNRYTIVEELLYMITVFKASRNLSFRVVVQYLSLSQLVPISGAGFLPVGTQETLTQLAMTKRKIFQSYSAMD